MINAIGIAVIISYDLNIKDKIYFKDNNALIEIIESKNKFDYEGNPLLELTCKYSIFMEEDINCKSLDDYAGHVFPFLNSKVKNMLVRNENYHFSHINQSNLKSIKEIMNEILNSK
ncbi:cytoplasmic protein [Bacillus sp. S13(2024)]|uniref:cytoplasmic protein n=1 Tax=unclassified Bacillus (in: firmicutes) TaxID=185979 RepID=UPI003D20A823